MRFQNAPFSKPFPKASVFIRVLGVLVCMTGENASKSIRFVDVIMRFLVQSGINLHKRGFQKAEIARAASVSAAISAFCGKTHKGKLIRNWTRKTVWLLINNASSNQWLWECVRCRVNVYPDTLNDFPSWLSTSETQLFSSTTGVLQKDISVTKSMPVWLIDDCVAWRRQFP